MKSILFIACLFLSLVAMEENEGFVLIGTKNSSVEKKSPEDEKKELRKKITKLQKDTQNLLKEIDRITTQPSFSVLVLEEKINTYNEILNEFLESSQLKESDKLPFVMSQMVLNQKMQTIKELRKKRDQSLCCLQ